MPELRYSMFIHWSEEHQFYLVTLPEFAELFEQPCESGCSFDEAALYGQARMETLVKICQQYGKPLPKPMTFPEFSLQVIQDEPPD
jgi:predicted RNase H-like HicB family nuclease